MKIAVILNGPPGCGKDTIANLFCESGSFIKHQFKDALYEHTAKHFEVDLDKFIHFASDRDLKDSTSLAGLGGRTPRQALIHVSEDIFKPRYGRDYFGKVEAARVAEYAGRVGGDVAIIYPDGGFLPEIGCLESVVDGVLLIRLHRTGFDFAGDSRSYLYAEHTEKFKSVDIQLIDGDIFGAVLDVDVAIENFKAGL